MNNRKIHHLDSSPPLSFLIIKDKDNSNTDNNINKPIVQNAGRFKKVQITILDEEDNSNSINNSSVANNDSNIGNNEDNSNCNSSIVNNDKELEEENDKLCKICNIQFSLYTCPRCNINYCSLECFKSHNSKCSTEFFEQQLKDNLKNIDKVSPKDSLAFLKRMKEIYDVEDSKFEQLLSEYNLPKDISLNQLDHFSENQDIEEDEDDQETTLNLDGLNLDEMTEEELLALLTKEEIEEFNNSIKDGTISNLIEEWVPWWTIDVDKLSNGSGIKSNKIQELNQDGAIRSDEFEDDKEESEIKLLLSRIPKVVKDIQSFSKLTNNKPASKVLYFHLIDILYCYCLLMRTFNGEWNLQDGGNSNSDTLLEGCKLILDLSTVLKSAPSNKKDLKLYQDHLSSLSSVENVLKNLLNTSHSSNVENNKNQGNIYFSLFLLQDVISILNNYGFILAAISHLYESFKVSVDILKLNYNGKLKELQEHQQQEELKKEYQLLASSFENISKKLSFFLSWINQENQESFKLLSNQVFKYFENEKVVLSSNNNNK